MLTATVLALVAAVLHAAWNLSVKQSVGDRFIALWGQFFVAGVLGSIALVAGGGIPARGFVWAALSGLAHLPYCLLLAKAYGVGDFSLAYPIARGGGALVAGLGGILLLGDTFSPIGVVGMVVVWSRSWRRRCSCRHRRPSSRSAGWRARRCRPR